MDYLFKTTHEELDAEVFRARTKFPGNALLLTALMEEVGELAKAYLQKADVASIRAEALQVACVALRIYEEGDPTYSDMTEDQAKP